MTPEELRALGFVVIDGMAVRIEEAAKRAGALAPPLPPVHARAWPPTSVPLPRPVSPCREKGEQGVIVKLFTSVGCRCEVTSQTRPSKVALGLPDLWVWGPAGKLWAFWWESKSGPDWHFTEDQLGWAERCARTNALYGAGDRFAAAAFLRALGIPVVPPTIEALAVAEAAEARRARHKR